MGKESVKRVFAVWLFLMAWIIAMIIFIDYWFIVYALGCFAIYAYAIVTAEPEPDWHCNCARCQRFFQDAEQSEIYKSGNQ